MAGVDQGGQPGCRSRLVPCAGWHPPLDIRARYRPAAEASDRSSRLRDGALEQYRRRRQPQHRRGTIAHSSQRRRAGRDSVLRPRSLLAPLRRPELTLGAFRAIDQQAHICLLAHRCVIEGSSDQAPPPLHGRISRPPALLAPKQLRHSSSIALAGPFRKHPAEPGAAR
jgi:hypothetical protein